MGKAQKILYVSITEVLCSEKGFPTSRDLTFSKKVYSALNIISQG